MFFAVGFTHERGRLFHGEGADLTCSVLFALKVCFFLKYIYMYINFQDLFDLSNKQGGGFVGEKLDHRVKRKLLMCVFVCVVGRVCVLTIFYSPQAPMGLEPPSSPN